MAMKLILREDVDNLGRLGDIVQVKPGYGRNYLIPKGMAMPATAGNLKVFETERKKLQQRMDAVRTDAQSLADRLNAAQVEILVRVGDAGKLYGSVTSAMIADNLEAQGIEIDRRKIVLEEPIRSLGYYDVEVKLHSDVEASVRVKVARADGGPMPDEELAATEAESAVDQAPEEPAETEDGAEPVEDGGDQA